MSAHEGSTNHRFPSGISPNQQDRIGVAVNWFGSLLRPTKAPLTMDPQVTPAEKHDTQVLHAIPLVSPELHQTALPTQVNSPVLQTVVTPGMAMLFRGLTLPPVESPVVLQVESPSVLQVESPVVLQVQSPKELWNDDSGVGSSYVAPC